MAIIKSALQAPLWSGLSFNSINELNKSCYFGCFMSLTGISFTNAGKRFLAISFIKINLTQCWRVIVFSIPNTVWAFHATQLHVLAFHCAVEHPWYGVGTG